MCNICKNVVKIEKGLLNALCKGDDFIFEDEGGILFEKVPI